jgi:hypothetical protein
MMFLMVAILTRVRWNLNVVLIFISFMARDIKHFFKFCLAIWTSSFEKLYSEHFPHWVIDLGGV